MPRFQQHCTDADDGQGGLRTDALPQYCVVPKGQENFCAISAKKSFQPAMLKKLRAHFI